MTISVNNLVFLALLLVFQSLLTFWSYRRSGSVALMFLVAFLPPVGIPKLLFQSRAQIRDNHVAGALTYLVLLVSSFAFLLLSKEETPWALIHTMQLFSFLGVANLVFSPFREES